MQEGGRRNRRGVRRMLKKEFHRGRRISRRRENREG
jgi:hypothetical protein